MSYPINQAITYTASALTAGMPLDTFTYAWTFDDSGTGNIASLAHTWTTAGVHSATVTATDVQTLGAATATKSINITDYSTLAWTNSGLKICAATSSLQGNATESIVSGTKLINVVDYYTNRAVVSVDTQSLIRVENTTCFPVVCSGGILLSSGANSGKILCFMGDGSLHYGFLDPTTLVYTQSSNSMAQVAWTNSLNCFARSIYIDYHRILICSQTSNSYGAGVSQIYDTLTDTYTSMSSPPYISYISIVKIGNNVIGIRDNSAVTDLFNITTLTWSSFGPPLLGGYALGPFRAGYINPAYAGNTNGLVVLIASGPYNSIATWDGVTATWTQGAAYPIASVGWTSIYGCMFIPCSDGMLMDVYPYGSSPLVERTKTELYQQSYFTTVAWPSLGWIYRTAYCNNRAWIAGYDGILYYSTPV